MIRPFRAILTEDQWLRCSHQSTALEEGLVQLAEQPEVGSVAVSTDAVLPGAGLAFDTHCRLFHSLPEKGQIERVLWSPPDPLRPPGTPLPASTYFAPAPPPVTGDFAAPDIEGPFAFPRGLAIDEEDRLYVADAGHRRVLVFDLWSQRIVSTLRLAAPPVDLVYSGGRVLVLTAEDLVEISAQRVRRTTPLPPAYRPASRLAISPDGEIWVMAQAATATATVGPLDKPGERFIEPHATDLVFDNDGLLVIARAPGDTFVRYRLTASARARVASLMARGYDGRGIVLTPDNRIGFWTASGFRTAVSARRRYVPQGRVVTYRFDSGEFHTRWGRVFLDACIPEATAVTVQLIATDDPAMDAAIALTPPANIPVANVLHPELSPPMPAGSQLPAVNAPAQPLFRRPNGRELPWTPTADGRLETYEAPLAGGQGRYLWIVLNLAGDTRSTPTIQNVRAEYPAHELLKKLPKIFSQEPAAEDFLRRYLQPIEGLLGLWDGAADQRQVIIDPQSAPAEMLPWLAGFLGLVLDGRWSERARREAIADAAWLFRYRGTIPGLLRFLEIYLGYPVQLVEQYRLRGFGGGTVGGAGIISSSVLGLGFRVGGAIGSDEDAPLAGAYAAPDAFRTNAHRFTVFVPATLTEEQTAAVRQILEVHRPAHTLYELCTQASGMRIGRSLYVGLTTAVGRPAGWRPWRLNATALGRGTIVGRPTRGLAVGGTLGEGSGLG
ncbi:MAG: phage tail protein [Acidobacteria bacterium]|nr:phage tail protein [Acidobacteriota bacterium]